jgi:predicted nucleotidyltransferase/uncharacterized protein (UPF0332 family)
MKPQNNPILKRFRTALNEMYGDRLERVVLFGSRARGDADEEPDYDIAVFLRDMSDRPAEMNRLADLATDILYNGGPFIHAMPYPAGVYSDERMPLMRHSGRGDRFVKPQTAASLAKSRQFLDKANDLFSAHHWPDEAGRAAYLAGLHAAQALIYERTGHTRKRHSTVQGKFAQLVRDDPRFDRDLVRKSPSSRRRRQSRPPFGSLPLSRLYWKRSVTPPDESPRPGGRWGRRPARRHTP